MEIQTVIMKKEEITQIIINECKKHIDAGKNYERSRSAEYSRDIHRDVDRLVSFSELIKLEDLISIESTTYLDNKFCVKHVIINSFSLNETLWDSALKTYSQKNIDDIYKAIENVRLYILDYINQIKIKK